MNEWQQYNYVCYKNKIKKELEEEGRYTGGSVRVYGMEGVRVGIIKYIYENF